eukprot:2552194-Amphidinium_carterae.1
MMRLTCRGDIAVARPGMWELLGRRDGMEDGMCLEEGGCACWKVRGRRIELGEIEEVLLQVRA